MAMQVSIIITAHNYGRFLRQCLDSALGQQFDGPFEVILVNDGSRDNTAAICDEYERRYPDRLRVLHLEGIGLSRALNVGMQHARGSYVVRLDADDYFDERLLMLEADFLDRHPEVGMVYPDHFRITTEGVLIDYVREQCRRHLVIDQAFIYDCR
jgi:glycosyltransferase involved in cell wall biosynthesis